MKRALLWEPLKGGKAGCRLCSHFCAVEQGRAGKCGVRWNRGGELFTDAYERVAAIHLDPVEKKPLYHFLPGSLTFSFGTMGCNLKCSFCQNASLSQPPRRGAPVTGHAATPEGLAASAVEHGAKSVSYTYSEPTIFFELMADTARAALGLGLRNVMVSNGFQSPACLDELAPLIQAANIDLKAFTEDFYRNVCGARLAPVLENLRHMRRLGWWLEVTTLVIPGLNDSPAELAELAAFLVSDLGPDTPWHISRFHPDHQMLDRPPTPEKTLEAAHAIGKAAGLNYVYVGNLPGNRNNKTFCPGCDAVLLDRRGFTPQPADLEGGRCRRCGRAVPGIFA